MIEICPFIDESTVENISIIPNPTTGSFSITGIEYERVKVYDLLGTIILDRKHSDGNLDITGQPSGIYIVQIIGEENFYVKRIVLE